MVGGVPVGSAHPVVVQSMTNTDTADADGTAIQVAQLAHAGSELVRITVNNDAAAQAVPVIRAKLDALGVGVPLIGDFHYNGHLLLTKYPEAAAALAKYRINPGNVGTKRRDEQFAQIIEVAIANDVPVRIGVNWGSLDQQLLTEMMDANAALPDPKDSREVMIEAMIESALRSARLAEETGLGHDRIILSAKVSGVQDLVEVYTRLADRCDYPLHLGLTEAGMGAKGIIASTAGLALLLQRGIGDTIRVSLTPEPGGDRTQEVQVAQQVLQSLGLRSFLPQVSRLPRVRPDHQHVLPGDGPGHPGLPRRADAALARGPSRASRSCGWRSWAASSTAPASRSTRTSGSACPARSRSQWRRCSSTARRPRRFAATTSCRASWRSSKPTSSVAIRSREAPPRRVRRDRRSSRRGPDPGGTFIPCALPRALLYLLQSSSTYQETRPMPGTTQVGRAGTALAVGLTIAIVDLTLITAYIHFTLGGTLFTLNALGYAALAAALALTAVPHPFIRRFAWLPRVGLGAYTVATIVGYIVIGPYFTLGWVAKGIEVAILVLLAVDLIRLYGSPKALVRAAMTSLRPGAEPMPAA